MASRGVAYPGPQAQLPDKYTKTLSSILSLLLAREILYLEVDNKIAPKLNAGKQWSFLG